MLEAISLVLALACAVFWFWSLIAASRVSFWAIIFNFFFFPFAPLVYAYLCDEPSFKKPAKFVLIILALQITLGVIYINQETDDFYTFYTTNVAECAKTHAENTAYIDIKYLPEADIFEADLPEIVITNASGRQSFFNCVEEGAANHSELVQSVIRDASRNESLMIDLFNIKITDK